MSRVKWVIAVVIGIALGLAAWLVVNQPATTSATATDTSQAAALPQPGQKLMPAVLGANGAVGQPYSTVQFGTSMKVALVQFGFNEPTYQRYVAMCAAIKARDHVTACDNQLVLTDQQCRDAMTDDIRQYILNKTGGAFPAIVRCQVVATH